MRRRLRLAGGVLNLALSVLRSRLIDPRKNREKARPAHDGWACSNWRGQRDCRERREERKDD